MSKLTSTASWRALQQHIDTIRPLHLRDLHQQDPQRAQRYSLEAAGLYLDYSKNRITDETLQQLLALAQEAELETWRSRLFSGETINHTEQRAVLHTALRTSQGPIHVAGEDVLPAIAAEKAKMREFTHAIRSGQWSGYSGRAIKSIVNIGIGGSDLGPCLVCDALDPYRQAGLQVHFVSNIDGAHIHDTLRGCDPQSTLFIVASKSFSTQETLNNALAAKAWFLASGASQDDINKHFVAVTSNNKLATEFGISPEAQFSMWDWVGGRYSLWSTIGLAIAISIGMDNFDALLAGAEAMDQHFQTAPLAENMPVILALLGVWYNNFLGFDSYAILPYAQLLERFPAYLQQTDMESNGKRIDREGQPVDYQTGPIIWGGVGTNAQHAFFQLMHQGSKTIPADFILVQATHSQLDKQQQMLLANAIAQTEALMQGKTAEQVALELQTRGFSEAQQAVLQPYMTFPGNSPSNTIILPRLDPASLGALLALYEHKVFVQGVIWQINSYDQWGVEYGKQLAKGALQALQGDAQAVAGFSHSSQTLIDRLKSAD